MRKIIAAGFLATLALCAICKASRARYVQTVYPVGSRPTFLTEGDFNRDGNMDLAVSNSADNTVSILLGNGDGTFQPANNYAAGQGTVIGGIVAASFTNNDKLDIAVTVALVGTAGGTIAILRGRGDGTFAAPSFLATGISPLSVAAADLNHDGNIDLVVGGNGSSRIFLGDGAGGFQALPRFTFGTIGGANCVAIADFNGDGNPDVIGTSISDGVVSVILGNGHGKFSKPASFAAGNEPECLAVSDFNGDGNLDVAVTNYADDTVSTLLGNGDGTFQAPIATFDYVNPGGLVATNINGDGIPDLVVADFGQNGGGALTELAGQGNGMFTFAGIVPNAGVNPTFIIAGRFNADALPDFAVTDNGGNSVHVFVSSGIIPAE